MPDAPPADLELRPGGEAAPVVLAIDGNSLLHRAFHSQAATGLRAPDGRPLWAIRGLLTQLVAAVDRINPAVIVVGFDDPEHSLRRQRWPHYKAGRADKLDALVSQLADAVDLLRELGLAVLVPAGLEADDVLASTARQARAAGAQTVIMTSDRDAFALIDESTHVLRIINGGVEASPLLTPERFVRMQGIEPAQYRDFAALRGDPSDNLPGVRGFGPKTAARLLGALGSVAAAFDDLAGGGARVTAAVGPALAARLAEPAARAAWELNCQIMAMRHDLELQLSLADGPGVLPLPAEAVRSAYAGCQLTWTMPAALRALAHHEGPPVPPPARLWHGDRSSSAGRRLPALPKKKPQTQLSLF
ncbi:MAG TPA: 5'-3' exonuclease H3TH domain-containing protein [Jatrophihabitans sp.]|nr:5'-3' exonuclease H3TH domain-containing protein [Jatrophihabitans sp.]